MNDKVYFTIIERGFYYQLGWCDGNSVSLSEASCIPSRWLIKTEEGSCSHSIFHTDFCLVKTEEKPPIWCMLAFNSKGRKTNCTAESFWDYTYMQNWNPEHTCLCLHSYPMGGNGHFLYSPSDPDTDTALVYPSDSLYSTTLRQNEGDIADTKDGSKSDFYRLYLNTHKIVPYTSPSGKKYFIFAYCYPGKKSHLYLGYCNYYIDNSSFVHLQTKTVLKSLDSANAWGDSFITDCSRIISLDVKNNEVWLTWMNPGDSIYSFFHIKASDLIPE